MKDVEDRSVGRAMRLFEYFEEIRRPLGVVEATEALGFPRSSTAALFSSLVKLGYLAHDRASRTYMPTAKLSDLGRWSDRILFGDNRVEITQLARAVSRATVETVVIGVRDDLDASYVHVELPERPVLYLVQAGATRPLWRSAVGWALLSDLEPAEVDRVLARAARQRRPEWTPDCVELVRHQLEHAREKGYVYSRHSFVHGIGMIAKLLPDRTGARRMAIGVGGPVERLDARETEILSSINDAIEALSAGASVPSTSLPADHSARA